MEEIKPDYYTNGDGIDLFTAIEMGLMSIEEVRGFYKGNIMKYTIRYKKKNGIKDLNKVNTYLQELVSFEEQLKKEK